MIVAPCRDCDRKRKGTKSKRIVPGYIQKKSKIIRTQCVQTKGVKSGA